MWLNKVSDAHRHFFSFRMLQVICKYNCTVNHYYICKLKRTLVCCCICLCSIRCSKYLQTKNWIHYVLNTCLNDSASAKKKIKKKKIASSPPSFIWILTLFNSSFCTWVDGLMGMCVQSIFFLCTRCRYIPLWNQRIMISGSYTNDFFFRCLKNFIRGSAAASIDDVTWQHFNRFFFFFLVFINEQFNCVTGL